MIVFTYKQWIEQDLHEDGHYAEFTDKAYSEHEFTKKMQDNEGGNPKILLGVWTI